MPTSLPQVRVGVGVFVLDFATQTENPHFLIGKRLNSHGAGTYALPGGHLEFGESLEECAAREVEEETGLEITKVSFLTATNNVMPEDEKHYVTVFMVCIREDENAQAQRLEPEKCEGWEWISWKNLNNLIRSEIEAPDNGSVKQLFKPLRDLPKQRPHLIPALQ